MPSIDEPARTSIFNMNLSAHTPPRFENKFLIFSCLFYLIIFLSSAFRMEMFFGEMALFGKVYYTGLLVPFLLALILWLLRNRLDITSREFFQNVNISLFVCLATILMFQFYLLIPKNIFFGAPPLKVESFDKRPLNEVVNEMRQQGVMAYPAPLPAATLESNAPTAIGHITIPGLSVLGLSGVANTTTVYCSESGPYLIYDSDEYGFSNPRQIWSQTMQIVFVGDSFTHGACVPSEDHFISIVRNRFPGTFNLGMRGNGPLLELATLKEFVLDSNPEFIFWMYFDGNDLEELARESKDTIAINYLQPDFFLGYKKNFKKIDERLTAILNNLLRQTKKKEQLQNRIGLPRKSNQREDSNSDDWSFSQLVRLSDFLTFGDFLSFGKNALCTSILDEQAGPCRSLQQTKNNVVFRNVMASAKDFSGLRGAKLVFVNLPGLPQSESAMKKRADMIRRTLEALDIDALNIRDLAAKWGFGVDDGEIFAFGKSGGHYNRLGYGLVGCAILNYISEHSDRTKQSPATINCSNFVRRSLYVVEDIPAGEIFNGANVRSIRPGYGLAPKYRPEIIGRTAARNLKKGEPLAWDMISDRQIR